MKKLLIVFAVIVALVFVFGGPSKVLSAKDTVLNRVSGFIPDIKGATSTVSLPFNSPSACNGWTVKDCQTTTAIKIEAELSRSPMKGLGQYIFDQGVKYGVDANFFTAIAKAESIYATVPSIALSNRNPGSLRPGRGGATMQKNNFALFNTWQEGIETFYKHITGFYFTQNQLYTVDVILVRYAPPAENDTRGYIVKIKSYMDSLRTAR